ncbi:hypothetical protein BDF19DRAFT_419633 [Syncephalis fuscata]|nr:hypothetical protein BDF19DRAFT_419633 [Syncephalis fuscata]
MDNHSANNATSVSDILNAQSMASNSPPPPYSPTAEVAKSAESSVDKPLANQPTEAVRLREREATRMDMSVRRSKVLSRAGLDDPVFFKMSQLERLVNSLQSALNDQSMAIHDVHGQLTEINDVLHTMQSKDEPSKLPQPIEAERLVEDLRAQQQSFLNLITDANIAVETPVSFFPAVPELLADTDDKACADNTGLRIEMQRRRQRREKRSGSGARIRPVKLIAELSHSDKALNDEVPEEPEDFVDTPELDATTMGLADTNSVTATNGPDAVEVRFYCQVTRTGGEPQRHEIRRRLVLPLITGSNLTPGNIRRIMRGEIGTDNTQKNALTNDSHCTADSTVSASYRGSVIRRALGTVQLMYWLLLFTLGVLMLDTYLCELAGSQAVSVVDGICPEERRRHARIHSRRQRSRGLLESGDTPAADSADLPMSPSAMEYTGLKPVTLETEDVPMVRNRSRRNSF